ncbi:hypothetical protein RSOL_231110 [Rhizoctonia solani AG-3 Rhs1AP]|uniref:Uncharacterized protein n=2 Tax=Rhizoctonia solani AG-3 TaxID=1086053 RepID=A0A074S6E6_9AGAM|nr:hypothetical protein RSOL_231110 [Rhizoctonia solani AG-3 Rhs1AP]KEP54774.1 hypothetical protein V565_013500 [Rhizoctonia solani 123E]
MLSLSSLVGTNVYNRHFTIYGPFVNARTLSTAVLIGGASLTTHMHNPPTRRKPMTRFEITTSLVVAHRGASTHISMTTRHTNGHTSCFELGMYPSALGTPLGVVS